jgi:hypothetical protein
VLSERKCNVIQEFKEGYSKKKKKAKITSVRED